MATSNTQAQLLSGSKIYEVLQYYYSPKGVGVQPTTTNLNSFYSFIGRVTPWPNENNPPVPQQDQKSLKQIFKDIITAKLVTSSDISPVIPRIDWSSGTIYDYYVDNEDMLAIDEDGMIVKNFYVRNRFDQIFKCLWNNNGKPSTSEPQFLPGTFDNTFLVRTADGYKWKYMYSLDAGLKQKFFDSKWMPVPIGQNTPNPVETFAAQGSIDVINITTVGKGYTSGEVTITISGDGQYANATALVNAAGYLYDVVVANTGQAYTYANVSFTPSAGFPTPNVTAVAVAPASPIGGHGFDPISELGCNHVMVAPEFKESEGGIIPTDMSFRQIGLLLNPVSKESIAGTPSTFANNSIYDVTTKLFVSPGSGNYSSGQIIYQGSSYETSTFSATVVSYDAATNIVSVINISGVPKNNEALIQDANGPVNSAVRTLLNSQSPDFIIYSGYLAYVENRSPIERSSNGTEQFRIVLRF